MSAGFTPAPWVAELTDTPYAELGESWVIDAPDTGAICTLDGASDEREANARLIAAAPELYEALELIWREWSLRCDPTDDFPDWPQDAMAVMNDAHKNDFAEKARVAIAKARGEQ